MTCSVWQITRAGAVERVGRYPHPADARRVLRSTIQRGAAFDEEGELLDERGLSPSERTRIEVMVGEWLSGQTLPAPPPEAPTLPAPPAEAPTLPAPPEVAQDLLTPKLYAIPTHRDEIATLRARVAELEAIAAEASAHADAAGARAAAAEAALNASVLRVTVAEQTAQAAVEALARETARADQLAADLSTRDKGPAVREVLARRPRRVRTAPAQHPLRALEELLRQRAAR